MIPLLENIPRSKDPRRIDLPGRILVAHQAELMPWLGFVSKATMGDIFLILDDTQFKKKYFENRNKIRFSNREGWIWLPIPIKSKGKLQNMMEVEFSNSKWITKHLKIIKISYSRAKYFDEIYPEVCTLYNEIGSNNLVDFNITLIRYAFKKFDINIPILKVSELIQEGVDIKGTGTDLVLSLCDSVNSEVLVAGSSGKQYLKLGKFKERKIKVIFQDFTHPIYKQYHGEFLPNMSFIDLLFNHGSEKSIEILGKSNFTY